MQMHPDLYFQTMNFFAVAEQIVIAGSELDFASEGIALEDLNLDSVPEKIALED